MVGYDRVQTSSIYCNSRPAKRLYKMPWQDSVVIGPISVVVELCNVASFDEYSGKKRVG